MYCHKMFGPPPVKSALVDSNGSGSKLALVECLGSKCALWTAETDEHGNPSNRGACAELVAVLLKHREVTVLEAQLKLEMMDREAEGEDGEESEENTVDPQDFARRLAQMPKKGS